MNALDVVVAAVESDLSTSERMVLIAVGLRASGSEGYCDQSIETLVEKTGLSERTVRTVLRSLVAKGVLAAEFRHRRTTVYRVQVGNGCLAKRLATIAPDQSDQKDGRPLGATIARQEGPAFEVVGAKEPDPSELPVETLVELLTQQRNDGAPLYPEPHINDRSASALQRAARTGWTLEELDTLFALAVAAGRGWLVWSSLLGPKYGPLQQQARRLVADRRLERERREQANVDPWAGKRPRYQADDDDEPVVRKAAK